ncbi:MAG: iron ABC transporter substrate-binding protein [bacterium]|nr:MAG: iron ABC transporter substrate-binding protein [bacterium]
MRRIKDSSFRLWVFCIVLITASSVALIKTPPAYAYGRIVVLYAAASPILKELGAGNKVVGITRTDKTFDDAVKLGSHLKPNLELINALRPDLIVAGSVRAFPREMAERVKADVFYYDPRSLEDILVKITDLGRLLGKEQEASVLVKRLREKLSSVTVLSKRPSVIYEISSKSLRVAGSRSIITSIIEAAGGVNAVKVQKKHVLLSPEKVLELNPDFYIYQVGPMNRNPEPPLKRPFFRSLHSKVVEVPELKFARPGINAFEAVIDLNKIFRGEDNE